MLLTRNIKFQNFNFKNKKTKIKNFFFQLKEDFFNKKNDLLLSLSNSYKYNFNEKQIKSFKKFRTYRIIGMGGSVLGAKAIYYFLKEKIKKDFFFIDNLQPKLDVLNNKRKVINIIISKSGNTLETISNTKFLINNCKKNIFLIENKKSLLNSLAEEIKSEIIEHNNFIGGRYSVLSEVGMLPAELMGLN